MISCTEFIPAYNEIFRYLAQRGGQAEVERYWATIFDPTGKNSALAETLEREGLRGCYTYWSRTLSEEAADFTLYLNERRGFYLMRMHACPSKGKLLKLQEQFGYEPYSRYCLHCDGYRAAVERAGLTYLYDFSDTDCAACSLLITDPQAFDGRVILDEGTLVMDRRAADNEYFHPYFHVSLNRGINYVGTRFGADGVRRALTAYVHNALKPTVDDVRARGLAAIRDKIEESYRLEKTPDAVRCTLTERELRVRVLWCPAVRFIRAQGKEVSPWYRLTTEAVMEALAGAAGAKFVMESYDEETGRAEYRFEGADSSKTEG